MADISATGLVTSGSNTDASSYNTASITPSANKLILAWVWAIGADLPPEPTLSGNGLTWDKIDSVTVGFRRLTLFRAMGASPSSGAVTISFGGDTQTGCIWSIVEYSNIDTSGSNGSGAIVQYVASSTTSTVQSYTVTLSAFSDVNNATAGGIAIPLNQAGLPDPGDGFTETGQRNQNNPNFAFISEFKKTNDTTVDASWTGYSVPVAGIAVEIKNATQTASFIPSILMY